MKNPNCCSSVINFPTANSLLVCEEHDVCDHDGSSLLMILHVFQENNYIASMNLSSNRIEGPGAGYLGRAVAINNSMESIDLSQNCIRLDGAILIGKSIMVKSELCMRNRTIKT